MQFVGKKRFFDDRPCGQKYFQKWAESGLQSFQLRGEFYGFIPIFPIKKDEYGQAYYGKAFTKFEYLGEISLVFQLSFGSISAYVNHYSSPSNDWNVGLTLGWQLFNSRFVE